jgi:hypothetical protein
MGLALRVRTIDDALAWRVYLQKWNISDGLDRFLD